MACPIVAKTAIQATGRIPAATVPLDPPSMIRVPMMDTTRPTIIQRRARRMIAEEGTPESIITVPQFDAQALEQNLPRDHVVLINLSIRQRGPFS